MSLIALLLAAAPVFAQDDAAFRQRFYKECVAAMGQFETTREHLAFARKNGISLALSTSTAEIPEDMLGVYSDGDRKIYINVAMIAAKQRELRYKTIDDAEVPRVVARKTLPTIAHELRHAMTAAKMRRELGFNFSLENLETEMISFVDEVRVLKEESEKEPDYWSGPLFLRSDASEWTELMAFRKNPTALKELVEPLYPGAPSVLAMSRDELLTQLDKKLAGYQAARAQYEKAAKEADAEKDPALRARLRRTLEDSGSDRITAHNLAVASEMRGRMGEPGAYEKVKAFYKNQIKGLIRKASE